MGPVEFGGQINTELCSFAATKVPGDCSLPVELGPKDFLSDRSHRNPRTVPMPSSPNSS
jgi:hypothetical protein